MAHLHSSIDPVTGAIDLDLLIAELERVERQRRLSIVGRGERRAIDYLDFDGERWLRRRSLAVVRGVLPEQHVRPSGTGSGGASTSGPVPAGRLDVDRHPVEHVQLQPLEHAHGDGVPGQGARVRPRFCIDRGPGNPGSCDPTFPSCALGTCRHGGKQRG